MKTTKTVSNVIRLVVVLSTMGASVARAQTVGDATGLQPRRDYVSNAPWEFPTSRSTM